MQNTTRLHSLCRWTFHSGKGGFLPADIRPSWGREQFGSVEFIQLVAREIAPRLPRTVELGIELHYDTEINDSDAREIADALLSTKLSLAMITPGAHSHFGYGGIASLDPTERSAAQALGQKTVDLTYGPLRKTWHKDQAPTLVLWNGSYGYDLASIGVREMYLHLKKSIAELCHYETKKGGELYIGIEPKPNEGHPAMMLPTVASALLLWKRLREEYGVELTRRGVNKEFGHSEMIGLDHIYDTVEELDNEAVVHVHMNSQGYNDGLILGGPGKFDIDHGVRINGMNITLARLLQDANFKRWRGHDMQVRPYDNEAQGIDRVVRSVLAWEACEIAAQRFDSALLLKYLTQRETAKAEDMLRESVVDACAHFRQMYS